MTKTSRFAVTTVLVMTIGACGGDTPTSDVEGALAPSPTSSVLPTTTSLDLESPDETAPDPAVPTTASSEEDTESSPVPAGQDDSVTSPTLTTPKLKSPVGSVPAEATSTVTAAVAHLSDRLGVVEGEILVVSAGFGSAPAENPCEPTVLDRRGEETSLVSIVEVVLRHGGLDYRYVEADGQLLACVTSVGK